MRVDFSKTSLVKARDFGLIVLPALLFTFAVVAPNWATGVWLKATCAAAAVGTFALSAVFLTAVVSFAQSKAASSALNQCSPKAFESGKQLGIAVFLLLEAAALFTLLSNYPGFCTTDSNDVIAQVLGTSYYSEHHRYDGLANHHPVFYTFCVWLAFKLASPFGDMNVSIFVFNIFQMGFVNACAAWSVCWLNRRVGSKLYVVFSAAFFVLSPVFMSHVAIMWKDVPFSALMLVLALFLCDLSSKARLNSSDAAKLALVLVVLSLLRNNGLYISVALLACMLMAFREWRTALIKCAAAFVLTVAVVQGPLFAALSVEKGHFSESIAVPLQQVANTLASEGEVSKEQRAFLDKVLPIDEWVDRYNPDTPNPLKFSPSFDDVFLEAHKIEFLRVWAEMLPVNFNHYVKAWILETRGYWQPGYQGWIGTGATVGGGEPKDLLGLGWEPRQIANDIRGNFPCLFGMGSYVWVILLGLVVRLARSHSRASALKGALPFLPSMLLIGTLLIAAPIVSDYRYVLSLYLLIPFVPVLAGMKLDGIEVGFSHRETKCDV